MTQAGHDCSNKSVDSELASALNPLIDPTSPLETLLMCRDAIEFMSAAIDAMACDAGISRGQSGVFHLLSGCIGGALGYEVERLRPAPQPAQKGDGAAVGQKKAAGTARKLRGVNGLAANA